MHTITCTWSPLARERVTLEEAHARPRDVPARRFERVLGAAALGRLRLRGRLTLTLFDDEWCALLDAPDPT